MRRVTVLAQYLYGLDLTDSEEDVTLLDENGEYIYSGRVYSIRSHNGPGGDMRDPGPYKFYEVTMYQSDVSRAERTFPLDMVLQVEYRDV